MTDCISPTCVEKVAFEAQTNAVAAETLGIEGPALRTALENQGDLRAAWDRGRFLRKVKDLAGIVVSVSQAGKELGMTGPEFRQLLDTDGEVGEMWEHERRQLRRRMAEAMVANAAKGNRSATVYCERFLRSEQAAPGCPLDYQRIPIDIMVEIIGKSRQTLHNWTRDSGCPRNADGTFDLSDVFGWMQCRTQLKRPRHVTEDVTMAVRDAVRAEIKSLIAAATGGLSRASRGHNDA